MSSKTVLLVEDDVEIRDALQDILEDEGFDVVPAGNGHQALQYLRLSRGERPHLVILDIMMPIVDGRQVLEVMKQDAQLADIPVIVVSATPRERLVGASAFIQKPIPLGTLFEMVRAFTATPPAAAPPPARPVSS